MSTQTAKTLLQVNAAVGLVCIAIAAALMSLALTQPETVAAAVAQHDFGTVVTAVTHEVVGWLNALLHFL
jgi:hypothetical protein